MLILLSPAKTLDLTPTDLAPFSQPRALDQAAILARQLRRYSVATLRELMSVSESIAQLNRDRFQAFSAPFTPDNAKQALLTFKGDSYHDLGLEAYDADDYAWAQDHLRILSGLYGVLRPLDLVQPYRLEMGTRLKTRRGKGLRAFWGDRITKLLNADLAAQGDDLVVNLASKEYFGSIKPKQLHGRVVDVAFKDNKNGVYKIISFFAKRARGRMASWLIKERASSRADLERFDGLGYRYDPAGSDERTLLFLRDGPPT